MQAVPDSSAGVKETGANFSSISHCHLLGLSRAVSRSTTSIFPNHLRLRIGGSPAFAGVPGQTQSAAEDSSVSERDKNNISGKRGKKKKQHKQKASAQIRCKIKLRDVDATSEAVKVLEAGARGWLSVWMEVRRRWGAEFGRQEAQKRSGEEMDGCSERQDGEKRASQRNHRLCGKLCFGFMLQRSKFMYPSAASR